jgi:hypothetical protein
MKELACIGVGLVATLLVAGCSSTTASDPSDGDDNAALLNRAPDPLPSYIQLVPRDLTLDLDAKFTVEHCLRSLVCVPIGAVGSGDDAAQFTIVEFAKPAGARCAGPPLDHYLVEMVQRWRAKTKPIVQLEMPPSFPALEACVDDVIAARATSVGSGVD